MSTGPLYPVLLTPAFFEGRSALVIGGGPVAQRKVAGLLAVGARVRLLAPNLTTDLQAWVEAGQVQWLNQVWQPDHPTLYHATPLVFAATNDPLINTAIYQEARALGCLVNLADDDGERSDFILPAIMRQGPLTVTVSSGSAAGVSPALVVHLRELLKQTIGPEWGELATLLAELRPQVKQLVPAAQRASLWHRLVESEALLLLKAGQPAAARQLLEDLIQEAAQC